MKLLESDDEDSPPDVELSEDLVFSLLSVRRRRDILRFLDREGGESSLPKLVEHVAVNEGEEPNGSTNDYKHIYVSLYQTHLPKLEAEDIIEHDGTTNTITLTERAIPLLAYLQFDPSSVEKGLFKRLVQQVPSLSKERDADETETA